MNRETSDSLKDEWVALLEAYDEALANASTNSPHATRMPDDDELPLELLQAKSALEFLHQVRQSESTGPACESIQFGRFRILRELGRGGFGVVHLAWDEDLQREVALKLPRAERLLSEQDKNRFLREGRAAATLAHPNIVPVYVAGSDGPFLYLATAYCPGPSLAQWLGRRHEPVPVCDAAVLARKLAEALQHAHDRGIIHRDIKPSNVLLAGELPDAPLDEYEPKLSDFGLAKLLDASKRDTAETREGAVLGTPAYMSPEQATGDRAAIGPATDVYGVGAILYEVLTGKPPFTGDSELAVLKQVERTEPQPPRALRQDIPRNLNAICLKCLEKQPQRRYTTCAALADDLQRFLDGSPVRARRAGFVERASRWATRNPVIAASLTLAFLSLATLVGTMFVSIAQLKRSNAALIAARTREQAAVVQSENHLRQARQALQEMVRSGDFRRVVTSEPKRVAALERAAEFYDRLLDGDAVNDALRNEAVTCYLRLAQLYDRASNPTDGMKTVERAIDTLNQTKTPDAALAEKAFFAKGAFAIQQGDYEQGLMDLRVSLDWNLKRRSNDSAKETARLIARTWPLTLFNRTLLACDLSRADQCYRSLSEQETLLRRQLKTEPDNMELKASLARVFESKIYGAIVDRSTRNPWLLPRVLEESLQLREEIVAARSWTFDIFELASLLQNQAYCARVQGRYNDMIELHGQQAEVCRRLIRRAPNVALYRSMLLDAAKAIGDFKLIRNELADAEHWTTLAITECRWLAERMPDRVVHKDRLADMLNNLATLDLRKQRFEAAAEKLSESVALREELLADSPRDPAVVVDSIRSFFNLGIAHQRIGLLSEAEADYSRVLEIGRTISSESRLPPDVSRSLLRSHINRSVVLSELSRIDESIAEIESAVAMSRQAWDVRAVAAKQYATASRVASEKQVSSQAAGSRAVAYAAAAREHLKAALTTMPPNAQPAEIESVAWVALMLPSPAPSDVTLALGLAEKFEAAGDSNRAARIRLLAAFVTGKWKQTLQEAEKAIQVDDARQAVVFRVLAEASRRLGNDEGAARYAERAQQASDDRPAQRLELLERLWTKQESARR